FDSNPVLAAGRGPSDPRFLLACDIYNAGVERLIRAAQIRGQIQLLDQNGESIPLKIHGRAQGVNLVLQGTGWRSTDVHKIILASDFEVTGLNREHSQFGVGVPLIAIREAPAKKSNTPADERFYPAEMAFPMTAFVTLESRLHHPQDGAGENRYCNLV